MTDRGLSKEEYIMLADAILYEVNPQAYLFFALEEMSREHSEITTADYCFAAQVYI